MTGDALSARLNMVADMVTPGLYVYDIGCDHAFLDIYLVSHGIAPGATAADVRPGPLSSAGDNIRRAGLEGTIITRLSDGLKNLDAPDRPSSLIIAGMGGPLILRILNESIDHVRKFEELIISPQSAAEEVRESIGGLGLVTAGEACTYDAGKYYIAMKLVADEGEGDHFTESEERISSLLGDRSERIFNRYGSKLIASAAPALKRYLEWEAGILKRNAENIKASGNEKAYEKILTDITDNELTYDLMEG